MSEYHSINLISKLEAKAKLEVLEGEELCLLLLALSDLDDVEWVQSIYLKYVNDEDRWIASASITGLGHLARTSGQLDKDLVIATLTDLKKVRMDLKGKISDAMSDIEMFNKNNQ